MRLLSRLFALIPAGADVSSKRTKKTNPKARVVRFEALERRELLAISASSADFQALMKDASTVGSDDSAVWVSSLNDVVDAKDGKITLREALDYAGQTVDGKTIASTIRFKVGGTIQLSSSLQSLKVLSKNLTIDASDVGGVTIQAAKNSLAFYALGTSAATRASVSIIDATILGGIATSASATSPTKGGAVQLGAYCDMTLENCVVRNASSAAVLGGGVYVGAGSLTLVNSEVSGNVGTGESSKGGAIYVDSGELLATNVKFVGNISAIGGAVYVKSGSAEFNDCFFESNDSTQGDGGALYVNSGSVACVNVGFVRNESAENGGALYVAGDVSCALQEVRFVSNEAIVGGAVYFSGESLSVEKSAFSSNKARTQGAAIYVDANSYADVRNVDFVENEALEGGAFYNEGQTILSTARFESNRAQKGGALYTLGYFESRDCYFNANEAEDLGGAMYAARDAQTWLLRADLENSKASEGAGVYNSGDLKIVDSSLVSNVATSNGGAVVNLGDLYVAASTIRANEAQGENGAGGGLLNYYEGTITIVNSTLADNAAFYGSGGALANNGTVSIVGALVASNVAGASGGAIYNGGTVSVQNSTFYDDKAVNGGACYGSYGSATNFDGVALRRNVASNNGGALYCYGAAALKNSSIMNNAAITAEVAPYFSPSGASGSVYVDSTTSVKNNVAVSSIIENPNENVVVADLATSEIIDGIYNFGNFAATSDSTSKSLTITNNGAVQLNFSQFKTDGDSAFSYVLTTTRGATLDKNAFALAPGETVVLTISLKPQKVGSKCAELNWKINESTEEGGTDGAETSLSIPISALTSKAASIATKITSTPQESGATISFDDDGTFTVALSKAPTENVVVYLRAAKGLELSTDVLLFTPENYSDAQTVAASIDEEALRDGDLETNFGVALEIVSADSTWNVAAIPEITFRSNDYVALRGENEIDLNEYVASGVSRWDIDGDGNVDATTNGDPCFVPSSAFTSKTAVYYQTKSGQTTSRTFDVIEVDALPSASAELGYVEGANGVARLKLTTETGVAARWRVDWGDGSPYSVVESLSTSALLAHCYDADGRYVVSVELLDSNGKSSGWNVAGEAEISGVSVVQAAFAQVEDLLETKETRELLTTVAAGVALISE